MAHHELHAAPHTVRWGYWDAAGPAALRVDSGDTVTIHTLSGEPDDLHDDARLLAEHKAVLAGTERGPGPHLLTGPVWVEGAEPGDVLEVRIEAIDLRQDWGWNLMEPGLGTLPEDFPERRRVHVDLDREAGVARTPWGSRIPLQPFFGNFGVAPPTAWGRITSIVPREHGGNMDNKALVAGTTVYFPVFQDGARFCAGDGHAAQGDGEVCLTAIETSLSGRFRLIVRKDLRLDCPRAASATHLITMGMHADLDEAARQAVRQMIAWLREPPHAMSAQDAYSLCSMAGDLHVTQLVDVNKGVHMMLPRSVLPDARVSTN